MTEDPTALLPTRPFFTYTELRPDFSISSTGILAHRGGTGNDRQLTWFDRRGNRLGTVGSRNDYRSIQLSPDESRVAIQAIDRSSGRSDHPVRAVPVTISVNGISKNDNATIAVR